LSTATGASLVNTMIEGVSVGMSMDSSAMPVRDVNTTFQNVTIRYSNKYIPVAASAATLALNGTDDVFIVSGSTTISAISSVADYAGRVVTLQFNEALTVTDGTTGSGLGLAGNFVAAAGSTLQLMSNGGAWFEVSRNSP